MLHFDIIGWVCSWLFPVHFFLRLGCQPLTNLMVSYSIAPKLNPSRVWLIDYARDLLGVWFGHDLRARLFYRCAVTTACIGSSNLLVCHFSLDNSLLGRHMLSSHSYFRFRAIQHPVFQWCSIAVVTALFWLWLYLMLSYLSFLARLPFTYSATPSSCCHSALLLFHILLLPSYSGSSITPVSWYDI